jgi:ribonuclease R
VHTHIYASAIKSKRRFTYDEVDDFLAHRAKWKRKLPAEIHQLLCRMHELAMILRQRRMKRGAIELAMPEIELEMDRDGKVAGAHRVQNTVSHQIIEEFMLAANEAVAEYLRDHQLYFLRRIHESPEPHKLRALTDFVRGLDIHTGSLESRFEIQRLLGQVADRPERDAVNYAVLRSMKKAVYGPQEDGHYALASDCYCHFTSPIRRYPDLTVHRMLDELSRGAKPVSQFGPLLALGEHCSDREQRAEAAERELTRLKLLNFLSTRIGMEMDAVVTGVQSFGLFAQGLELPAEGLIHVSSLADDYYDFDGTSHTLCGRRSAVRFRLGDTIRVAIVRVDPDRRELDFRVVGRGPRAARKASPPAADSRDKPSAGGRRPGKRAAGRKQPSNRRGKSRNRRSPGR